MKPRRDICQEATLHTVSGTESEKWHYIRGTDHLGNLPDYKKNQHVGHCFMPCPYSLACDSDRARIMLGLSNTDPLPVQNDHLGADNKYYFMGNQVRGGVWGYECTYPGCSYLLSNGVRYFYV